MPNKKIYSVLLMLTLYPASVAFANPTIGPPSPAYVFILPIIVEVGVILYLLRDLSFKKIRLGGAVLAIHIITYPAFFFTIASFKGSSAYGISVILGEVIVALVEGVFLYIIAKSQWLQFPHPLSFRRAIFTSTLGNICSFLTPYIALFLAPIILLIRIFSIDLRFVYPICFLLLYLYLRKKPFLKSISSLLKVILDISIFVVILLYAAIVVPYPLNRPHTSYSQAPKIIDHSEVPNQSCRVSSERAIAKTKDFMNKIGLTFHGSPVVEDTSLSNIDYPGIRNLKEVRYEYPDGKIKVRFYVGCESGEVENFDDVENWEDNFPYSSKKEPRECKKAIESLAQQIGIPSDMYFEKVENNWRKGIWVGKFVRIRDGYRYELDGMDIGISDKTHKIALYKKIYFGQTCPTEIKITKDVAVRMASTEFHKFIFGRIRSHSDELYDRNVQLLIIQPERPESALSVGQSDIANPPLKEKPSRLAWIIRYYFTGGIKSQKNLKTVEEMSPQERQNLEAQWMTQENLLGKHGYPVDSFEMRIDADNGDILYVSHKDPLYYYQRWISPGFWK